MHKSSRKKKPTTPGGYGRKKWLEIGAEMKKEERRNKRRLKAERFRNLIKFAEFICNEVDYYAPEGEDIKEICKDLVREWDRRKEPSKTGAKK